ncbi:MAG: hypothetical protein ACYTEW_06290 [Planctomycetota bacterium]
MKVTADGCNRKNSSARQEMKKRFLLNGVNMNRVVMRKPINHRAQHPVDIYSDPTLAALPGLN